IVKPGASTAAKSFLPELTNALHIDTDPPGTTGSCDCNETRCVFVACKTSVLQIDGTFSYGGGHVQCTDLKYAVAVAAGRISANFTMDVACDITVTPTSIDGSFETKGKSVGTVGGNNYTTEWDSTLQYKAVTFPSGGGAPTGGSVHADGTTTTTNGAAAPTT